MELNFGKFLFSVRRKQNITEKETELKSSVNTVSGNTVLNYEDIQNFNEPVLNYIRSLPDEEIVKRIKQVSVEHIQDNAGLLKAKEILKDNGIVVVPNFVDEESILKIENEISAILKLYESHIEIGKYFENEQLVIDGQSRVKGYGNLANHEKSVIGVRQGQDKGMIDVFNVERLIYENRNVLTGIYKTPNLIQLLNIEKDVKLSNINIYINNHITKTRGFHVDNYNMDYKGFIYLTDVLDLDNGPYCFVKKTNRDNIWRIANKEISKFAPNKTESPLVNYDNIVPVLAPKGSLVISDQSGVHRGFPQGVNGHRKMLVARYR